ncbi:unnamed protein product, partial [Didymodactylos carnosus]
MTNTRSSKRYPVVPNGLSEEEVDSSESEDEMDAVKRSLLNESTSDDQSSSSEEDYSEAISQTTHRSKKKKKLHWKKKDFSPPPADFTESLPPPPDQELNPVDYFYLMFGKESIQLLTHQSNLYSVQTNPNKPLRITENEIKQFIGVLILTGVYSFPQQRFFWTSSTRVESQFRSSTQSSSITEYYQRQFQKNSKRGKLSADEQTIPFKGRSIMKQYMPKKPNRCSYKMFLLAGAESGICYDFVFFTGKSGKSEHGFSTKIILQLCETVPHGINHKLYFDNYYTTIQLQVELYKLGIHAVGTIRSNRFVGLVMKNENELSKEGRGAMDHRVTEVDGVRLYITRWYDNNVVNCLSTLYGCHPINLVQRWSPKEKKYIQITQPGVVKSYNQHMGGVNLIAMLISLYRINIRSQKYYLKIIFHLIDLSLVNAWLLYRRHCSQFKIPKKDIMSLLSFRISVAEDLLKSNPQPLSSQKRGRPSLHSIDKENLAPI